jgi:hypothetical protein
MEPIAPNATITATSSSKSKIIRLREGGVESLESGCSDMVNILMFDNGGLETSTRLKGA